MFRDRLKQLRTKSGMSQKDLAVRLNISQQAIGKWETGVTEPSIEAILKLSQIFDCSTDYLLGRTDHPGLKIITAPTEYGEVITEAKKDGLDELTPDEISKLRKLLSEREEIK